MESVGISSVLKLFLIPFLSVKGGGRNLAAGILQLLAGAGRAATTQNAHAQVKDPS